MEWNGDWTGWLQKNRVLSGPMKVKIRRLTAISAIADSAKKRRRSGKSGELLVVFGFMVFVFFPTNEEGGFVRSRI